jgi:hypothetical protein
MADWQGRRVAFFVFYTTSGACTPATYSRLLGFFPRSSSARFALVIVLAERCEEIKLDRRSTPPKNR